MQSFVDVENALIAVQQNTEHEKRLAAVVASARLAYDITKVRLREGTIDILTVINTEQTLFSALDAQAVVRFARFTALSSLAQAIGGGWTRPEMLELPALDGLAPVPLEAVAPDPTPAQGLAVDRRGYTAAAGLGRPGASRRGRRGGHEAVPHPAHRRRARRRRRGGARSRRSTPACPGCRTCRA